MTREQWLIDASNALRPLFQDAGSPLPVDLPQLSIGFPSRGALSRTKQIIGQCWGQNAVNKAIHVFVSPVHATPFAALDTLAHELVHVVTPGAKHGGKFVKVAKAIGLTSGKPTSAGAGPELTPKLEAIIAKIGVFPHSALNAIDPDRKRQTTRMLKAACASCEYTVRLSAKWLTVAAPVCPDPDCANFQQDMRVNAGRGE